MKAELKVTKNSNKFRKPALHYQKYDQYLFAPQGTSEYVKYWSTEYDRCKFGYTAEDGDFIPGYFYFYLNYFPISLIKEVEVEIGVGKTSRRASAIRDFPSFYDYDRFFFESIENCEEEGKHLIVLKARRKGYSYKIASMLLRNYYFFRGSKGFALAAEAEFLVKDGILTKTWDGMDFLDQHTAWFKKRQVKNTMMWRRASFLQKDDTGVDIEIGYKSEIMGVTLKNDPQKARGKGGRLIIFEEAGKFRNLLQVWQIARPSVEQGSFVQGTMIGFGCTLAGTKLYTKEGRLVNVEDLKIESGTIGYNGYSHEKEDIVGTLFSFKKQSYKITLNSGRFIECSYDHPMLFSKRDLQERVPGFRGEGLRRKKVKWAKTEDLKIGDQLAVLEEFPFESNKEMWEPRFIGLLIGDGSYGYNKTPVLSNADEEVNSFIDDRFNTVIEKSYITKDGRLYRETRIKGITKKLRGLGIYGQTKNRKAFPIDIHSYSENTVTEILSGFFDADGYIYQTKTGRIRINFSSSFDLLLEVLYLLQRLGIHGKIHFIKDERKNRKIKSNGGYYRLSIEDLKSLLVFSTKIISLINRKQTLLNKIVGYASVHESSLSKYISGIRFERIVKIEDLGEQPVYNLQTSNTHTYIANGIVTKNTGGEEGEDFDGLKELFERPKAYNCLELDNIWDEENIGQKVGFFVPQYANLEGEYYNEDDKDDPLNGEPFMDDQGNTRTLVAKKYVLLQRSKVIKNASDRRAIDRHIAEQPIIPAEALLDLSSNIFPKADLQRHLAHIRNDEKLRQFKQVGDLYFDNEGIIKWMPVEADKAKDIIRYRLDPQDDPKGQIVIWEHPMKAPPWGLYIAGCLTPGEKVNTSEGLKNVEDVTLEDKLINKEGEEVEINTLLRYEKVNEPTYKVHMYNVDRPTNYTQEHPLYVADIPEGKFDFIRAEEVEKGMWTKAPNYYKINSKEIDTTIWDNYKTRNTKDTNPLLDEDFWWFVGHWLGDGFNHKQGRNYTIYNSFGKKETDYIDKYKRIVKELFNRNPNPKVQNGSGTHKFEFKQLFLFLEDNFGKYADGKYISEWVKYIPEEYKLQLVLGYLDSDGSVYLDNNRIVSSFKSINRKLLYDIQDILFSVGIVSSFHLSEKKGKYNIKGKIGNRKESYRLRVNQTNTVKLYNLYNSLYNSRKLKLIGVNKNGINFVKSRGCQMSEDLTYIYIKIKNIEVSTYSGTVYNFDCKTHSFICQYFSGHNCDPYDHDKSGTNSLGSTFIFKRIQSFEEYYDMPVAEYTGRPDTAAEYYENVRKLLMYYNATLLYENEKKGLFFYFEKVNATYLLADQPNDLIGDIVKDSKVDRKKGIHMSQFIKDWGEGAIRDWLVEEFAPGKKNLTKIMSEPLLEELIAYNDKGNFDRVMAFMLVMMYRQQLHKLHVKKNRLENKKRLLFPDGLFTGYDDEENYTYNISI